MQKSYETPVLEVVQLQDADVIVTSPDYDFNDWFATGGVSTC